MNDYIDQRARTDLVCHYFTHGMSLPNIYDVLQREHGLKGITRDLVWHDLSRAANNRWLKYTPPPESELGARLKERFHIPREVYVPSVGERMTVVTSAAKLVTETIRLIALAKADGKAKRWNFKNGELEPESGQSENAEGETGAPPSASEGHEPDSENSSALRFGANFAGIPGMTSEDKPMILQIRIGFSGGRTMAQTAEELAVNLTDKVEEWEKDLKAHVFKVAQETGRGDLIPQEKARRRFRVVIQFVFINLVSGFDTNPEMNPIAFLTRAMLDRDPLNPLKPRSDVVCFNAPSFVEIGHRKTVLAELDEQQHVRSFVKDNRLDITLTGTGSVTDEHSMLRRYFRGERASELLSRYRVTGDLLWNPVTDDQEFFTFEKLREKLETEASLHPGDPEKQNDLELFRYQPMTLLDLDDMADLIKDSKDVFLIAGPCTTCYQDKSPVLTSLLNRTERKLVSHLIVDKHTARATLGDE